MNQIFRWVISRGCSCFGPITSLQFTTTHFSICLQENHSRDIIAHIEGHGIPYTWHFLSRYCGSSAFHPMPTQQQQFVNIRGESKPQAVVYQYSSQCRALIYNTPGPSTMDVRRSLPSPTHIASPPNRSSTPPQHIGLILYMRISLQGPTLLHGKATSQQSGLL